MVFFIATTISKQGHALGDFYWAVGKHLARRGHKVVLLSDGHNFDMQDSASNPAVLNWPSKRPTRLVDALFLNSLINEYRPNLILSNFGADNICMTVGFLKNVRTRMVWHHTPYDQLVGDFPRGSLMTRLLMLRKRLAYSLAHRMVCATHHTVNDLITHYGVTPSRIIHRPYLLPEPESNGESDGPIRNQISFVGRFYPSKGQDCMIRALPAIMKEFPDVHVVFTGQGPTLPGCVELARTLEVIENCSFVGRLPSKKDVYSLMRKSWVNVGMSTDEGFGLVFTEALSVGTPVVATDIPAIREIVTDGKNGFLIRPNDHVGLAEKVLTVLREPRLRDALSHAALEEFHARWSVVSNGGEYAEWMESCATSG